MRHGWKRNADKTTGLSGPSPASCVVAPGGERETPPPMRISCSPTPPRQCQERDIFRVTLSASLSAERCPSAVGVQCAPKCQRNHSPAQVVQWQKSPPGPHLQRALLGVRHLPDLAVWRRRELDARVQAGRLVCEDVRADEALLQLGLQTPADIQHAVGMGGL